MMWQIAEYDAPGGEILRCRIVADQRTANDIGHGWQRDGATVVVVTEEEEMAFEYQLTVWITSTSSITEDGWDRAIEKAAVRWLNHPTNSPLPEDARAIDAEIISICAECHEQWHDCTCTTEAEDSDVTAG